MGVFTDRLAADMKARPRAFTLSGAGVKADGTDQSAKLQAVFDAATAVSGRIVCDVQGAISVGSTVTLGNLNPNSTRENIVAIEGNLRMVATAPMTRMMSMRGTFDAGNLTMELDGANLAHLGVYSYNIGRSRFGSLLFRRFLASGWGNEALMPEGTNNNNCFSVRDVQAVLCGSKHTTSATVTKQWDGGMTAIGSNPAVSEWTLSTPLPTHMRSYSWLTQVAVMADGRIQTVMDVSADGKVIKIAHEARSNGYSETITLHTSAIHWPYNPDAGAWQVGNIDVSSCPNAASLTVGGYGGNIDALTIQYNALGIIIPMRASGLNIGSLYTEGINTWLYACHVNHRTAGTSVSIGAGQKTAGTIQIGDQGIANQGYMTMAGRSDVPKHWVIVGHHGDSPVDKTPAPLVPYDGPEHNPGTRNLTPGTLQMYSRSSGAYNLRIANAANPSGVGMVTLTAPTTGGGTAVNLSLLTSNGDTIQGAATHSLTIWGTVTLTYGRIGTDWTLALTGTNEATT